MLKTIEYLKTHSLGQLTDEFGIRVKAYPEKDLVVLNYDQIDSPRFNPIADECRGLIISPSNLKVVAKSFNRFYNLGEGNNNPESWKDWSIMEKADGSIIRIYYYQGIWEIATRGTAFAEAEMMNGEMTFREGVLKTLGFTEEQFQDWANEMLGQSITYTFEYISPMNRVVTPYKESQLVLLGMTYIPSDETEYAFNILETISRDLLEIHVDRVNHPAIRLPYLLAPIETQEQLDLAVSSLTGLQEGFVCINLKTGERIKVKSLPYLKAHRVKGNGIIAPKDIAELIVENEHHEFLSYFPEDQVRFDPIIEKYRLLTEDGEIIYNQYSGIQDQKEFALQVKGHPMSAAMFLARSKNISFIESLHSQKTSYLVKLLVNQ